MALDLQARRARGTRGGAVRIEPVGQRGGALLQAGRVLADVAEEAPAPVRIEVVVGDDGGRGAERRRGGEELVQGVGEARVVPQAVGHAGDARVPVAQVGGEPGETRRPAGELADQGIRRLDFRLARRGGQRTDRRTMCRIECFGESGRGASERRGEAREQGLAGCPPPTFDQGEIGGRDSGGLGEVQLLEA